MTFSSHEEYFESIAPEVRPLLVSIQERVESVLPDTARCISYNLPAFREKRVFFYFAAFKKHIGIYPPVTQDAVLIRELAPYRGVKGNLSFPLNQPLPIDLIERVAVALNREYGDK
ncbi:iron chaperone [Salinispirillum marinum]|uniref:Iron chaperone n=2 Tax=Saccharospirillaceae TaxID=255527 RepID=A0ABV8BEF2_9GAMM